MILNHLVGIFSHPKEEWQTIEREHESLVYSLSHILVIALIPAICVYFSLAHIGWTIGVGEPIMMTQSNALVTTMFMYVFSVTGVFTLATLILWMAKTFDSTPDFAQAFELATYTATPLLVVGICTLYPVLWFVSVACMAALAYSVYLLYSGVPILMNIPEEKGFIYASSVVTCGLVVLVALLAASVILVGVGVGSEVIGI